jgi:hypothetical protein
MGRLPSLFRGSTLVLAVASVAAFVGALASGHGIQSLAFLGAGVGWLLVSHLWAGKARAAKRHRELREKRLDRERRGLAPPRG